MMRFKTGKATIHCVLAACLGLLLNSTTAFGVRVAGEEGVTPSAPAAEEPKPKIQRPAEPPKTRSMPRPPPQRIPQRAKPSQSPPKEPVRNAKSPDEKKSEERFVTIDFDNVDIAVFIKFMSELTGKTFVIDKGVAGKVTILSPTKISIEEAYKVFESVLEVYGFATVPAGNIVKIVPAATAKSGSAP